MTQNTAVTKECCIFIHLILLAWKELSTNYVFELLLNDNLKILKTQLYLLFKVLFLPRGGEGWSRDLPKPE